MERVSGLEPVFTSLEGSGTTLIPYPQCPGAGNGTRTRFAGLGSQGTAHIPCPLKFGGTEGIRTPHLLLARQALSRMSYGPTGASPVPLDCQTRRPICRGHQDAPERIPGPTDKGPGPALRHRCPRGWDELERAMGFGPTTSTLARSHSTTELRPQNGKRRISALHFTPLVTPRSNPNPKPGAPGRI